MPPPWKADRRLYLNADKTKVVEEGDPAARFLLVGKGQTLPSAVAMHYGLGNETNAELLERFAAEGGDVNKLGTRPSKTVIRAALADLRENPPADDEDPPEDDPQED